MLKGKILGSSKAPDAVAVLGITAKGYQSMKDKEDDEPAGSVVNITHSTVTFGDKNKIHHNSALKIKANTAIQAGTIKGILAAIFSAIVAGLIVWYLTR